MGHQVTPRIQSKCCGMEGDTSSAGTWARDCPLLASLGLGALERPGFLHLFQGQYPFHLMSLLGLSSQG